MDDPVTSGLLERYFAGECTDAQRASVERWIADDPSRGRLVELLRAAWSAAGRTQPFAPALQPGDVRMAWRAVAERSVEARPGATVRLGARTPAGASRIRWRWVIGGGTAVCAAVLLALVFGLPRPEGAGWRAYTTGPGQRLSVTLSDGTQFTLAPASQLRIAPTYASRDRAIVLAGEAFFTVTHDAAHPFSVRAGQVVATDIGTQFDVRAYAGDRSARVAVTAGVVAVARAGRAVRERSLQSGDVAVVDTAVAVTHTVDVRALTAWTAGRFVFREGTLADVAADIARWYDLDVTVDRSLTGRHLVGSLSAASADDALHVIAGALDVRVARDGRRVRISPRT